MPCKMDHVTSNFDVSSLKPPCEDPEGTHGGHNRAASIRGGHSCHSRFKGYWSWNDCPLWMFKVSRCIGNYTIRYHIALIWSSLTIRNRSSLFVSIDSFTGMVKSLTSSVMRGTKYIGIGVLALPHKARKITQSGTSPYSKEKSGQREVEKRLKFKSNNGGWYVCTVNT